MTFPPRIGKKPWTTEELAALCTVFEKMSEGILSKIVGRKESLDELARYFQKGRGKPPEILGMTGVPLCVDDGAPEKIIRGISVKGEVMFEFNIFDEQPYKKRL